MAAPASAHATLERTSPAVNARLTAEPQRVVLYFDQPVSLALGAVTVIGPGGTSAATEHHAGEGGRAVLIELRQGAGDGAYAVSYRVISQDAHPVSGGFSFEVGTPGALPAAHAGTSATAVEQSAPEDTTVRAIYAGCRYAGFVGLLLLVGGAVFRVLLWPARAPDRRIVRQIWLGYGVVVVGSLGELVLQAPYAAGTSLTGITAAQFDAVAGSTFGSAHLVRLALLALAAPLLVAVGAQHRPGRRLLVAGGLLGAALVVTWAYSGHAATATPAVSVPGDAVHLAAMAVWLGGLVALATALLPASDVTELRSALPRWSVLAFGCVAALIVSGVVQALLELDGWSRLVDTSYGQLLLAKIGLLAVVLLVAGYSRRWVRRWYAVPGADPSRAAVRSLRRGVAAESLLAAGAVAVAAMLVEAAPGRALAAPVPSASSAPIARHGPYESTTRRGNVDIYLKVDPAVVGVQYIHVDATRPDGSRMPVRQWTLTVSNAELGLDQVNVPLLVDSGVGHYDVYGSFTMPTGGSWTVEVIARTGDFDETVVARTVQVRP